MDTPDSVAALRQKAEESGFLFSSDDSTGELLAVLAAAVPANGRILELGTGFGVGLGWIAAGLGSRSDVSMVTVEKDAARSSAARQADSWPSWVSFIVGDAIEVVSELGTFDLVFADAEGGKWYGLDKTIAAVKPHGLLVLDDLQPQVWKTGEDRALHLAKMEEMRTTVTSRPDLLSVKLGNGAGVLLVVHV